MAYTVKKFSIINKAHREFPAYITLRHFQSGMEMGTDAGICTPSSGPPVLRSYIQSPHSHSQEMH